MLDYNTIIRLKKMGLNNLAIANGAKCKWDSVEKVLSRCESVWGSVDGVPDELSNEEIADFLYSSRKCVDLSYLQPDCEKILEKQRQGYQRNELWTEYCAEAQSKEKNAYKLSRFNEIVSDYRSKNDISFTMNHVPGLEGQADWTGDHGHFVDTETGELVEEIMPQHTEKTYIARKSSLNRLLRFARANGFEEPCQELYNAFTKDYNGSKDKQFTLLHTVRLFDCE